MQVPPVLRRVVPASERPIPLWLRLLAVPLVAALVVLGIWVTGGLLTNDYTLSLLLTGVFLTLGGVVAVVLALRWRSLTAPVLGTFVIVAGSLGGYLLVTSHRNVVVNEAVVTIVDPTPTPTGSTTSPPATPSPAASRSVSPTSPPPATATALSRGQFVSDEHKTTGTATVARLTSGGRVVTLTNFATSPGPDLRVYLVPGDGSYVDGYLDLGHLKGNKGNQQYTIPDSADLSRYGSVIIWCRAFTVAFGHATLA